MLNHRWHVGDLPGPVDHGVAAFEVREPPRLPVPALRLVHEEPLAPVHPAALEGLGVAEPVEVALQPPGR